MGFPRVKVVKELKKQLWLAGPLILISLLMYSLQVISLMFVGHHGKLALSSAAMATSFASATSFSILLGMACALETLCGQSYGAEQHHMLGIHMQRAMFILLLVSLFLSAILANTKPILIFIHQDPEISQGAGEYAHFMIPSLFAYSLLQCLVKFLITQNNVFPMILTSGTTILVHIPVCWSLVFKTGLGSKGAAVANSVSYWIHVLLLAVYVKFSPSCAKTWTGFSREALSNILSFIKLAIPSAIMVCLEMWSLEMVIILSGLLPNPKLETSVLSICFNTAAIVWMIPYALSATISTRVSNELGAGNPEGARLAVSVVLLMAIAEGIFVGIILIMIRNIWGHLYSNDTQVMPYLSTMLLILAASNVLDGISCVLSGTARGCGWQKFGAMVNLGCYYFVGIPSAVILSFVLHLRGKGLWLGLMCAHVVQVPTLLIVVRRTDWEKESKKAAERVRLNTSEIPANIES